MRPPHSPELNPLDFFFLGAAIGKVKAKRPQTMADLKEKMAPYAAEVTTETQKKVGQNFCNCMKVCFHRNGVLTEHVGYKKFV